MVLIKKLLFLFKGDRQSAPDIEEAVEVREDYKLSKDEVQIVKVQIVNETQQRQVTETIKEIC
jgi:hypothetical protein